ncbi:thiamine pyrophosphate-dependent enzyme [Spartinivicinus poritis]|uniref:Thiamine pyrophosphate-dependent enzyme n=1 Tax=Spartinivicinus poritis TaxID=2994640 RepID=A0ABT5U5P2_9GAMM|nr:thiamine pyrophosphate-dependent enzyme [Spartinivicinus sp. A2-2]MDE1461505.1 thiamine pyrophosphate-dependent enzyme [Spartinivicinus sp. A2-2]
MDITIGVVVITESNFFFEAGLSALSDLQGKVIQQVTIDADISYKFIPSSTDSVFQEAKNKAINYLNKRKDNISVKVIQAPSLKRASEKIINLPNITSSAELQIGMVYVDYTKIENNALTPQKLDQELVEFYASLKESQVNSFYSSFTAAAFTNTNHSKIRYQPMQYIECILPTERSVLQTKLLCLWMDFFEMSYANRRIKPTIKDIPHNLLGEQLLNLFSLKAQNNWLFFYFTGSIVSSLIQYVESKIKPMGIPALRGPSEHSLACGAMANWQLYQKPFLIVVTSGMIDEFKGTLANLRDAKAKGIIICAENRANQWFAFQGTISQDEDTRDVLAAYRVPHLYMDNIDNVDNDLLKVAELYDLEQGPVVLLVTQAVLEAVSHIDINFSKKNSHQNKATSISPCQQTLDKVVDIINHGPEKLLWQCGPMNDTELEMTLSIASRAGIALVDSLTYPGVIPKFYNGKRNSNYLGTLSIYGYSPRVYNYLHTNNKLNPPGEQCLFFLKSKIPQIATPFPEGRLERKIDIVQLTNNPNHIAPFTNHGLTMNYLDFLHYVNEHLNVPNTLRIKRYHTINSLIDTPSDVVNKLPTLPMSPNFFFAKLNDLIERLIVEHGYDYTGLYDVGRCGISAIRNVAKTRRGFSGWYGRALMGDALLASVGIAYTCPTNIIAFIGDGAKGVVPDVLPSFIENAIAHPNQMNKNITIFFFQNAGHSVINTYQERILFKRTSRQMRLVNIHFPDWEDDLCGLKIKSQTIETFDNQMLASALLEPQRINLFSVVVSHNNEGDGISLATATGWQRDDPVLKPYQNQSESSLIEV